MFWGTYNFENLLKGVKCFMRFAPCDTHFVMQIFETILSNLITHFLFLWQWGSGSFSFSQLCKLHSTFFCRKKNLILLRENGCMKILEFFKRAKQLMSFDGIILEDKSVSSLIPILSFILKEREDFELFLAFFKQSFLQK